MAKKVKNEEVETEVEEKVKDAFDLNAVDENGQPYNQRCTKCLQVFPLRDFYAAPTTISANGKLNVCKACVQKMAINRYGKFTPESVYNACQALNRPFIMSEYKKANEQKIPDSAKMGEYMRLIAMKSKIDMLFADGETPTENKNGKSTGKALDKATKEMCEELFGYGLKDDEYSRAYSLFCDAKNNYPLKTNMHKQALATWAIYKMKTEQATANGDASEAEKWGKLAKSAATDAKINPAQLSAADLSEGMTCFSQLSAAVEKAVDVIPLFPEFREEPKDRVDYTLWEYINYSRHMMGMPLVAYKDIYGFLDRRRAELQGRYAFLKKEEDGNFDEDDIDGGDS